MSGDRPTVVLVDDHALFRSGVGAELGDAVEIVGEASDIAPAVDVIVEAQPDVVLLDVHLVSGTGDAVIAGVGDRAPQTRYLALSVSDAPEDVLGLVRAGARGYVTKNIGADELVDAVRRVAEGDAVFSPRLAGFVLDAFTGDGTGRGPEPASPPADDPEADEELDRLSPREREVMRFLARGYAYKEIARELGISIRTVESHTSAVLRKLQLSNRHQLTHWAASRDIV